MPSKEALKNKVCREIDRCSKDIIAVAENILNNPEPGFKEFKTARLVADEFKHLGLNYREGLAVTGIKAVLQGRQSRPMIAVIRELDSLVIPGHQKADSHTGAAHACGHNAQIGMLIGVATGLIRAGVMSQLDGSVALMAVPAEEYIELDFRQHLREEGKIKYLGGKAEFIRLGEFDDVDMAIMTHSGNLAKGKNILLGRTGNGTVAKRIKFMGRASHAGGAPHLGINALNAATLALSAIHAQRETFKDNDTIRVHPIITKGGEVVNIVPDEVIMETFVRGKTIEAIQDAARKVDRALKAGAMAVGAKVKISTLPGYMPLMNNPFLQAVYRINATSLVGRTRILAPPGYHSTGSTDMGDVSHIMPAIHPTTSGAVGVSHGIDFVVNDYLNGVIVPAKIMAMTVIDLLAEEATLAKDILAKTKPLLTKDEYLKYMDSLEKEELFDGQNTNPPS